MTTSPIRSLAGVLLPLALLLATPAAAQPAGAPPQGSAQPAPDTAPLPAWDQLTDAQREALVAQVRDRWNEQPGKRARMLAHAERWRDMGPEEREHARRGANRWRDMEPEKREAMRALYARMKALPESERKALRERWQEMSPEERRAWVKANPAPAERPREP